MKAFAALSLAAVASGKVYFQEDFKTDFSKRWTVGVDSKPAAELGQWTWTGGDYAASGDKGIKTSEDARFYSLTAPFDAEFDNKGKDLVVSYTVKHEQNIDCGGAYIKLLPPGFEAKKFGGETPYAVMFGPDVCGTSTRKTHVIFTDDAGKNHLIKKTVKVETDNLSHRYTLVLKNDNSFEVFIDGKSVEKGTLEKDFDIIPSKTIKDPEAKKPADWVDNAQIDDPTDVKPAGYDDIPARIADAAAKKPEDWDDEEDGEWEAPTVANPEYKGPWSAKKIANPEYKGVWVHPEIANPEYKEEAAAVAYHVCEPCSAVGFELWQVKAGTIFDDIIVTDSLAEADAFAAATFDAEKDVEKTAYDAIQAAKKEKEEAERKEAEEKRKAEEAAKGDAAAEDAEDADEDDEL